MHVFYAYIHCRTYDYVYRRIDARSSDRPYGVQTPTSSTPVTSTRIVTNHLRVTTNHVEASPPVVVDIDEIVNVVKDVEL